MHWWDDLVGQSFDCKKNKKLNLSVHH